MTKKCKICLGNTKRINCYSYKCLKCNFYFSSLRPGIGQDVYGIENLRRKNFKKLIKIILKKKNNPKILEIGSGDGFFIDECLKANISITGSEASIKSLKNLKQKFNINFLKIRLPEKIKIKERYDVIIFNDVFEHLKNLNNVIYETKKLLKKEGLIVLNLPSSNGFIFRVSKILLNFGINKFYDRLWQKGSCSPHISYFNKENLVSLFAKDDFQKIDSGNLDTVKLNNYRRFKDLFKSYPVVIFFSFLTSLFYFLQFFLPKDIIYVIFKSNSKKKLI